jgi:NADH dehydrogenase/NADH:ubiquinone oxidoreductase subunit G
LAVTSLKTPNLCLDFISEQGVKDGILMNKDVTPNANALMRLRSEYPGLDQNALAELINSGRIKLIVAEARVLNSLKNRLSGLSNIESIVLAVTRSELDFESGCVLPYAAYFETEGHFINYRRLVQKTTPAVAPPDGVMPLWTVLSKLSSYTGAPIRLEEAETVRERISEFIK